MSKRSPEKSKALVAANGTDGGGSKVPALKSTNFHINFLALTAALDKQVKLWNELCNLWCERNKPVDLFHEVDDVWAARKLWTSVREGAEQCLATMNALWTSRMPDPNIDSPSAEWLGWRIGEMLPVWELKMSKDEMLYMADRLETESLHGMVWESVFREIEDTKKKPPVIAEVLELLKKTKHIADWKGRLAAVDLDSIRKVGEETVFALDFKKSVFEVAVLEYLDIHDTDLAAEVRENEDADTWRIAIEDTAKSEGLSELVAKINMQNDYSPNSEFIAKLKAGYNPHLDDPWQQARQILKNKKHVMLEWDLLFKNAQRRLNHDKAFVCSGCGAGYYELEHCKICTGTVVDHAQWEQHVAHQQKELQQQRELELNLSRNRSRRQELIKELVASHDDDWMAKYIELEKLKLPSDRYIEILHCYDARWDRLPKVHDGTAAALSRFDNPMLGGALTLGLPGVHYVMTCVYKIVERNNYYWGDEHQLCSEICRGLELKTMIPFKYEIKENDLEIVSDRNSFDQLLPINNPTIDEQAQLAELRAKLYAAYLPPPNMIAALQQMVLHRIEFGLPPSPPSRPLPLDPYERLQAELNRRSQG